MNEFFAKNNVYIQKGKKEHIKQPNHKNTPSNVQNSKDPARFIRNNREIIKNYISLIRTEDKSYDATKANYWLEWIDDSEKKKFDLFKPGQLNKVNYSMSEDERIVYLEANPSQEKLQELKKQGKVFIDEEFPATSSSLNGTYGDYELWKNVTWEKISEKLPDAQIFNAKIEPGDIKQGTLGDCYFLAGLAALAEVPERIRELFLITEKNSIRYYSVKILYKGKWRIVNLDEMVPFQNGQSPAFSDSVNNQLWVILLEKAWAKIYKSYRQIEAGFPEEPLHDLTGAPVKRLFLHKENFNADKAWEYLLFASQKIWAMVSCSNPGSNDQQSNGIILGHAYTFLKAVQIKVGNRVERLVQLRNPWAEWEYNGRWSDEDSSWNYVSKEVVESLGVNRDKSDGIFFMSFDDYINLFRDMYIAEINDRASYVYQSYYDPKSSGAYFTIQIIHKGLYSFQIDNTPERAFTGKKQEEYHYPEVHFHLKKVEGKNNITDFGSFRSHKRTFCHSEILENGKYLVFAKIDFDPNFETTFKINLAVYAEYSCGIYLSSIDDAILFTGDPSTKFLGQYEKYVFKPIITEKVNNLDKWIFDYGKPQDQINNNKEEEKHGQDQEEKREQEMKKKHEEERQNKQHEEEKKRHYLEQEEKKKKKQKKKDGSQFGNGSSWGSKNSFTSFSRQQNNMDFFNDHFQFHNFGKKRDPNTPIKPKKKIVTKEVIKKTITFTETKINGEVKKQEVEREQKINTKQYGSNPSFKKKVEKERSEVEVRESIVKTEPDPLYRYERILREKQTQIENEKGEVKKKLQTDENISETIDEDEPNQSPHFLSWVNPSTEKKEESAPKPDVKIEQQENKKKEDEANKSESVFQKNFMDKFLKKEKSQTGEINEENIQVLEDIARKVLNDDQFKRRNVILYHESDSSDDILSFGRRHH